MLDSVLKVYEAVRIAGGDCYLVGGSVRDMVLGLPSKDIDIEVFGVSAYALHDILVQLGEVKAVGQAFAVFKCRIDGDDLDISIPRRESKTGSGHRAFEVVGDPFMSMAEAARRRDFTINALYFSPASGEYLDSVGGMYDLKNHILRVVDPTTFADDSLRVLRAMQFVSRFGLTVDLATMFICRSIDLSDLPKERIWAEFEKLLLSPQPSLGFLAAFRLSIFEKLFPEFVALVGSPQELKWHPEGSVATHTALVLDCAAALLDDLPREKALTVMLAALCHDLGKPSVTKTVDGRIHSHGHDEAGVPIAASVLDKLGVNTINGYDVRSQVLALVKYHLYPAQFYRNPPKPSAYRRLAQKVDIDLLYRVSKADGLGRGVGADASAAEAFIENARDILSAQPVEPESLRPAPILMGRHLLALGFKPGPAMGRILNEVFELQIEGEVATLEEATGAALAIEARGG